MKEGSHLNAQGVDNGNADNGAGNSVGAEHEHMTQAGFGHQGPKQADGQGYGEAGSSSNSSGNSFGNPSGNFAGDQGIGGLFPEGMNPDILASLNLDGSNTASEGEAKPAFDDLLKICRDQLCPICPTCKEAEEDKLRALADVDNTKKRLLREKEEQTAYVAERILNDIIPALDNLHLALQHAPQDAGSKNFVVGVEMTLKLLLDALGQHGLEEVGRIGEEFDPAIHEAMGMNNVPEIPDNHISALLSKGYRLKGRLLRPAKVMVCKHS